MPKQRRSGTARPRIMAVAGLLLLLLPFRCPAQQISREDNRLLNDLIERERNDAVIELTTALLSRMPSPNPKLLYFRGNAEWELCWFDAALRDMEPLQDYSPYKNWPPASETVAKIKACIEACPKHQEEIRMAGKVAFRIFYDEDNKYSRSIINLLPQAFKVNQELFGFQTFETPIFIFNTTDTRDAFVHAYAPKMITEATWAWAFMYDGAVFFSSVAPDGTLAPDPDTDYFRGTATHEYTHALLYHAMGSPELPPWLDEGLAMLAAGKISPKDISENDKEMEPRFANHLLLPLATLSDRTAFRKSVRETYQVSDRLSKPDAYQQAFHMARFLHSGEWTRRFHNFFTFYGESGKFEESFQAGFQFSVQDFYRAWVNAFSTAPMNENPSSFGS